MSDFIDSHPLTFTLFVIFAPVALIALGLVTGSKFLILLIVALPLLAIWLGPLVAALMSNQHLGGGTWPMIWLWTLAPVFFYLHRVIG